MFMFKLDYKYSNTYLNDSITTINSCKTNYNSNVIVSAQIPL